MAFLRGAPAPEDEEVGTTAASAQHSVHREQEAAQSSLGRLPAGNMNHVTQDDAMAGPSAVVMPEASDRSLPSGSSPDDIVAVFGRKVRRLRQAAGLTLEQVARLSGVSIGALSQMERGLGNPSLATVFRVAQSLGSSAGQLLDGYEPGPAVVRSDERPQIGLHGGEADDGDYQLVTPPGRPFEMIWMETPPGHSSESHPYVHEGEEVGIVLSGVKEVHVGQSVYILNAGDSITFPSHISHWYRNIGPEPVVSLWMLMHPKVG